MADTATPNLPARDFAATAAFRMAHPPYVLGGLAMLWGFARAGIAGAPRHPDAALRAFVRAYQRRALLVGKGRAIAEIESRLAPLWRADAPAEATA